MRRAMATKHTSKKPPLQNATMPNPRQTAPQSQRPKVSNPPLAISAFLTDECNVGNGSDAVLQLMAGMGRNRTRG